MAVKKWKVVCLYTHKYNLQHEHEKCTRVYKPYIYPHAIWIHGGPEKRSLSLSLYPPAAEQTREQHRRRGFDEERATSTATTSKLLRTNENFFHSDLFNRIGKRSVERKQNRQQIDWKIGNISRGCFCGRSAECGRERKSLFWRTTDLRRIGGIEKIDEPLRWVSRAVRSLNREKVL